MIFLIFLYTLITKVLSQEYKTFRGNQVSFYHTIWSDRPNNFIFNHIEPAMEGLQGQSKQVIGATTTVKYFLESTRWMYTMVSTSSMSSDKRKINGKKLTNQVKQDLLHNRSSYFLYQVEKMCLVDSRRDSIQAILRPYLSAQTLDLVTGLIFGGSQRLSTTLQSEIKVAGISHILSASGSNVSLVLLISSSFIRKKFGKIFTIFLSVGALVLYLMFAGCTAPLIRASLMATLNLLGILLLRRSPSLAWLLLVTCGLMILFKVSYLTSVSFQLSVGAMVGILAFSKLFPKRTEKYIDLSISSRRKKSYQSTAMTANSTVWSLWAVQTTNKLLRTLWQGFCLTLIIQLTTLPIVIFHFNELSILSVVSNVCLLWLVPWMIAAGLITLLCSIVGASFLAMLGGQLTEFSVNIFLSILHFFGRYQNSILHFTKDQSICALFIYFVFILMLFVYLYRLKTRRETWRRYLCN